MKKGEKWHRKNEFTRRMEFLYVQEQVNETFKNKWAAKEEEKSEMQKVEVANSGRKNSASSSSNNTKTHGRGGDGGDSKQKRDGTPGKEKMMVETTAATTTKLKKALQHIEVQYQSIVDSSANDDDWQWARRNLDDLKDSKMALDGCTDSFCRTLLTNDFRDLRREYDNKDLCNMVATLEQAMPAHIQRVQKEIGILLRMHRGRKAV